MLLPNTPRSWLPGVFIIGESRLPGVFTTVESFWTPGSHFTYFKEHTTIFKDNLILKMVSIERSYQLKGLPLNMWCWEFISIFFSLHPLISIIQLRTTTAERIGVVYWIGVLLQVSGRTTPVGAIICTYTTNRCGAIVPIALGATLKKTRGSWYSVLISAANR